MKDFFDKISSYNIFNYLLPGVLTTLLLGNLTQINIVQNDLISGAFIYYFIGLIVSRVGSLFVEPVLKKFRFVKFAEYREYVQASKVDQKIEVLSEVNNMYRTFISMFICVFIIKAYEFFSKYFSLPERTGIWILSITLLLLFLMSYKKQSDYIKSRCQEGGQ